MAFGLDISDLSIEVLQLKKSFGKIKFSAAGRLEIPAGLVVNGAIKKKKELAEAIKKVCREARPDSIRDREIVVSLPEAITFSRILKFPKNLNSGQLAKVLKFEVPNVLPINTEEVYSDFVILRVGGNKQEIFYAACPKKIIDDLREVLKMAGLGVIVFDMETASLARALALKDKKDEGSVIVDVGARSTVIAIFDQSGIRSSTTIKVAGNLFTEEISKRLKIKEEKAEELKKACGLSVEDRSCREGKVFLALQSLFPPIISEIKKSVNYYEKQAGRKIGKIILCGGSRVMPGLADYLKSNLNLETEVGKPHLFGSSAVKISQVKNLSSLIGVFGLAERAVDKDPAFSGINLRFSLEEAAKRKKFKKMSVGNVLFDLVVLFAILGAGFWALRGMEPLSNLFSLADNQADKIIQQKNIPLGQFEMMVSTAGETGFVQGRVLEIKKEGSGFFPATVGKTADGRAEGTVKIINNSGAGQTLVATTRLLSAKGVLFRLKDSVTVPAGASVRAVARADQEGASGNIGASQFIIPGLSSALQKLIYAESESAMAGGTREITFVGAKDIEQAKIKLLGELVSDAQNKEGLSNLLPEEFLLPVVLGSEISEAAAVPAEGAEVAQFELKIKANIKFLAVRKNDLELSIGKGGGGGAGYDLEKIKYSLVNSDEAAGQITIEIDAGK
jgi:type IV pilus assembly protein PilM